MPEKRSVVVHTCHPGTQGTEAGQLQVQGQPRLQSELKASLHYTVRLCFKNTKMEGLCQPSHIAAAPGHRCPPAGCPPMTISMHRAPTLIGLRASPPEALLCPLLLLSSKVVIPMNCSRPASQRMGMITEKRWQFLFHKREGDAN